MQIRRFFSLARRSVQSWLDDYAPSMGAAIAFYTVFSLAPLVMIVIGIAGFFWGEDAVRGELLRQIGGMVGENGAAAIEGVIRSGAEESDQGAAAGLISAGVLLVGATTVFAELQRALDRIWEVPVQEKQSGIWNLLRARLLSLGLVLSLAFLLGAEFTWVYANEYGSRAGRAAPPDPRATAVSNGRQVGPDVTPAGG